jgi:hypothetical protein
MEVHSWGGGGVCGAEEELIPNTKKIGLAIFLKGTSYTLCIFISIIFVNINLAFIADVKCGCFLLLFGLSLASHRHVFGYSTIS